MMMKIIERDIRNAPNARREIWTVSANSSNKKEELEKISDYLSSIILIVFMSSRAPVGCEIALIRPILLLPSHYVTILLTPHG